MSGGRDKRYSTSRGYNKVERESERTRNERVNGTVPCDCRVRSLERRLELVAHRGRWTTRIGGHHWKGGKLIYEGVVSTKDTVRGRRYGLRSGIGEGGRNQDP